MKEKKKSLNVLLIIAILVIVIAIIVFIISKNKSNENENEITDTTNQTNDNEVAKEYVVDVEDGIKLNRSSKLTETKKIGELTISNIQLTTQSGMSTIIADVTNNGTGRTELKNVQLTLLDEEGNILTTLSGVIEPLDGGKSSTLNVSTTSDFVGAYDLKITEK